MWSTTTAVRGASDPQIGPQTKATSGVRSLSGSSPPTHTTRLSDADAQRWAHTSISRWKATTSTASAVPPRQDAILSPGAGPWPMAPARPGLCPRSQLQLSSKVQHCPLCPLRGSWPTQAAPLKDCSRATCRGRYPSTGRMPWKEPWQIPKAWMVVSPGLRPQ